MPKKDAKQELTTEQKIDALALLVAEGLVEPMEATLLHIKRSDRMRKISLAVMVACVLVITVLTIYTLNRIDTITQASLVIVEKVAEIQKSQQDTILKQELAREKVSNLVTLAQETATSSEISEELKAIQNIDQPTPENLMRAAQKLAPNGYNGSGMAINQGGENDGSSSP